MRLHPPVTLQLPTRWSGLHGWSLFECTKTVSPLMKMPGLPCGLGKAWWNASNGDSVEARPMESARSNRRIVWVSRRVDQIGDLMVINTTTSTKDDLG